MAKELSVASQSLGPGESLRFVERGLVLDPNMDGYEGWVALTSENRAVVGSFGPLGGARLRSSFTVISWEQSAKGVILRGDDSVCVFKPTGLVAVLTILEEAFAGSIAKHQEQAQLVIDRMEPLMDQGEELVAHGRYICDITTTMPMPMIQTIVAVTDRAVYIVFAGETSAGGFRLPYEDVTRALDVGSNNIVIEDRSGQRFQCVEVEPPTSPLVPEIRHRRTR